MEDNNVSAYSLNKARGDETKQIADLSYLCSTQDGQEKLLEQNSVFYHGIVDCIAAKNKADFKGIGALTLHTKEFQTLKIRYLLEGFIEEYDTNNKSLSDIGQSGGNSLTNFGRASTSSTSSRGKGSFGVADLNYNSQYQKDKRKQQAQNSSEIEDQVEVFESFLNSARNNPTDNKYYKEMVNILNDLHGSEVYSVALMDLLNHEDYIETKKEFYESHKNSYFRNCIKGVVAAKNLADYPAGMTANSNEHAYQHEKIKCLLTAISNKPKLGSIGLAHMTASAVNAVSSLALKSLRGIGRAITDPFGSLKRAYTSTRKANSNSHVINANSPQTTEPIYAGGSRKRKSTRRIKRKSRKHFKRKSRKPSKGTK
jgi:hypothetical protein